MTTEDDFHAMLIAHPDDHVTRLILADFLDDRGDPRGLGYRALAVLRRVPVRRGTPGHFLHPGYCTSAAAEDVYGAKALVEASFAILADDWLALTKKRLGSADPLKDVPWACADTPRAAEDAAALAFADLPTDRQRAVLAVPVRRTVRSPRHRSGR